MKKHFTRYRIVVYVKEKKKNGIERIGESLANRRIEEGRKEGRKKRKKKRR